MCLHFLFAFHKVLFQSALGQKVRVFPETDKRWLGWGEIQPWLTVWGHKCCCGSLYDIMPLPKGGKKNKVIAQLRIVLGSPGLWMLVLINLLQQLHFYEPSFHLTFTMLCWLLTSCRLLKVERTTYKTGEFFFLMAKCKRPNYLNTDHHL